MRRLLLSALLAFAPALAAAAQVRALPAGAPVLLAAPAAAAVPGAAALVPALSAASGVSLPPALFPAAPAAAALPASAVMAGPAPVAAGAAPAPAAAAPPDSPDGKPAVLHSLKDLARILPADASAGERAFDGSPAAAGSPRIDPSGARPAVPAGVRAVVVEAVRTVADVDRLIPDRMNSHDLRAALRARLGELLPFDARVYRDARGGSFTGIDLSKNPGNVERLPDLHRHEVATIRKIQAYTPDLQVLVREDGATPDLVAAGVVTEMKSVHGGAEQISLQLDHANRQLVDHARRHGLGLGAAVLDLIGVKASPQRVEAEIAKAVADAAADGGVGFGRVYVFSGAAAATYAPGPDGAFRLSAERPFSPASAAPVPAGSAR